LIRARLAGQCSHARQATQDQAAEQNSELPHRPLSYQNRDMSRARLPVTLALLLPCAMACDKSGPLANLDLSPEASSLVPSAVAPSTPDAAPPAATHAMPPRPVPTSSPTVLITMPMETQLQAIQYMAAMQAPWPSDAPADPDYAKQIADGLKSVGRPDVISSGRLIEVKMDKGCDATLPKQALARSTGAPLGTLLAHGILVVKCLDRQVQCLQSTRDADDVLCTHK
jgi:hypothetical protein